MGAASLADDSRRVRPGAVLRGVCGRRSRRCIRRRRRTASATSIARSSAILCQALGITTRITWSSEYHPREGRNERLIDLCVKAGATEYLSGPAARDYIDEAAFAAAGMSVAFADYDGYAEYPQPYPPFEHFVSALDLLFCCGPRAVDFMKDVCPKRVHA